MTAHVDCIIVGAGVIGLAIGRELSSKGQEVIILEKETSIGSGISSRNSEVIHSGIYYTKDSLKARLCVEGCNLLYDYCEKHHINHKKIGKLIVASNLEQENQLEELLAKGRNNGVDDLVLIGEKELHNLEPNITGCKAIYSPSAGILDSHGFMLSLQGDLENKGGSIAFGSNIISGNVRESPFSIDVMCQGDPFSITCKTLINAAGLYASSVSSLLKGLDPNKIPKISFCKGNYFSINGRAPFKHLIYPLPDKCGLGTHSTLDLGGRTRFGPDTQWIEDINYDVDPSRHDQFIKEISAYWPDIKNHSLVPDYSGIRPKIKGKDDFFIQSANDHNINNLINLYAIESPGLTACLAIAKEVSSLLK